ncbi:MAG TPA: molybdopterin cofactor-binding domain-containing protein [Usitatibacter sp.]|nr:molybdopterin cofactor-binding domain-containing protein [Usitatibacter sp.]
MSTRREFLQRSGALVMSFSLAPRVLAQAAGHDGGGLPGSLKNTPHLDAWIRIDTWGAITVCTGKAELGQGIKTALLQIAADELRVPMERLKVNTADTGLTANEGFTAGSRSMQDSGTAIRNAAAQVREKLLEFAAEHWKLPGESLRIEDGRVVTRDGRSAGFGDLVAGRSLHVQAQPQSRFADRGEHRYIGRPVPRVDIPAKVAGEVAYVHDVRLPGMLHARVVRPPSYGAKLVEVDTRGAAAIPGVVRVIRDGDFLAVVAHREWTAVKAMRLLQERVKWEESAKLPDHRALPAAVLALGVEPTAIHDKRGSAGVAVNTLQATYTRPYQIHGSIGPACAVAELKNGTMTVWTHTQGVYPDRQAIAQMLGMPPDKVRCIHAEGSGCYGHNAADDAAADAALIAWKMPGQAVRVQWMREQEHAWEPFGPAMVSKVRASLDPSGRIIDWDYGVWSNTHSMRPGPAGNLLAGQHSAKAFKPAAPKPLPQPEGGGDRNAIPLYVIPTARVVNNFIPEMPLRVSALRALGAYLNVFAIESFMDELAAAAHADPVDFRLRHLEDQRAREVVQLAASRFGWKPGAASEGGRGRGFGFARYKNLAAYCAVACEVDVDLDSGRVRLVRFVAAVDSGEVVNPDGLRNQIEGAILQSASWTLYEAVSFDRRRIRSVDWATYPILRFNAVPEGVEVHLVDRPGMPFLGSGECGQGPTAGAIANAIAHATGRRVRDLPLNAARIRGHPAVS